MRTTRGLRAVLCAGLLTPLLVLPGGADAVSGALACSGAARSGPWQVLPVEAFRGVEGVSTRDVVTGYSADPVRPQRVLATNGNTVKVSTSYGCAWEDGLVLDATPDEAVPVSGASSSVVATAVLPEGPVLAAVREGTGPASRPHVAVSRDGRRGSWTFSDSGLPAQGAPRLLHAAGDGRTAYLLVTPVGDGGGAGGTLPALPGQPGITGEPAGSLYATTNGGASWSVRAAAGELPAETVDAIAVDQRDPELLYLVSAGRLLVSRDGGRTLTDAGLRDVTTVVAMEPGEVAVSQDFDIETGLLLHSTDAGRRFAPRASVRGLSSLAYRRGDAFVLAEGAGRLYRIDARRDGRPAPVPAPRKPVPRTALGDRSSEASYTVLAEHALLRWVDLAGGTGQVPRVVIEDLAAPPPPKGRVAPPSQSISIPVGESRLLDYTLVLPPSPTPLDLVFLVDTSPNMGRYIADLRQNLRAIAGALAASGIDVRIGLATAGPGPGDGEPPYPEVNPATPGYRKPSLYRLLRPVGPVDRQLQQALDGLRTDSAPQGGANPEVREGQLVSLREIVTGQGVEEETSTDAAPRYAVPPGQAAGFRPQEGVRRLIIHATDEPFNNPHGTPRKPDGSPDLEGVAALLKANRVQQAGISPEVGGSSLPDLRRIAELTGARVPAGGLDCSNQVFLKEGDPLVCQATEGFSRVITDLVRQLTDRQDAVVAPDTRTPVVGAVDGAPLRGLDVTRRNDLPLRVRVSCVDVRPGTYDQRYTVSLRGFPVAQALARVSCTLPAAVAAVPPRPPAAQVQDPAAPAGQPAAQAPAPPAPAPPVVQPQAQPQAQAQTQVQAQVQPVTAAMLQQQQELQLALALSADERPTAGTQMAMVDRRRSEQLRALALLAASMAGASALGAARLRSRRHEQPVRVRASR